MVLHLIAAASSGGGLSVDNPLVLGPIAAFIFTIFVTELVVSGKAYRREVEENQRLRGITEKVVPLAEQMVTATKEIADVMRQVTNAMEEVLDRLAEDDGAPPRRRRRPS